MNGSINLPDQVNMSDIVAREKKEEEEKEEKGWSDLPWDLLDSINSRLYAVESIMFRAVCKSWQSIPPIPQSPPIQIDLPSIKIDPQLRNIPYLMNFNGETRLFHFHNPITNATYMVDFPDLAKGQIRFSKDGWLLVCRGSRSVYFFNLVTRMRTQEIPLPRTFKSMFFSCPPTLLGCTVFGVSSIHFKEVYVSTFRHGNGEPWSGKIFLNNEDFVLSNCCPVLYNGLYYCLGRGGNLGIFDPKNETWHVLGKPLNRLLQKCEQSFLLQSDGDIFGIFVSNDGRKIEVLRLEKSSHLAWHEVESLKDKMFYVCNNGSYSTKAAIRGTENKICFPKFYNGENLFYSLGTRQYHSFLGNFSERNLLDIKEKTFGIWIKKYKKTRR